MASSPSFTLCNVKIRELETVLSEKDTDISAGFGRADKTDLRSQTLAECREWTLLTIVNWILIGRDPCTIPATELEEPEANPWPAWWSGPTKNAISCFVGPVHFVEAQKRLRTLWCDAGMYRTARTDRRTGRRGLRTAIGAGLRFALRGRKALPWGSGPPPDRQITATVCSIPMKSA
jgi:hypothetical protein